MARWWLDKLPTCPVGVKPRNDRRDEPPVASYGKDVYGALADLTGRELLTRYERVADRLVAIWPRKGRDAPTLAELGRELSRRVGGQVWVGGGQLVFMWSKNAVWLSLPSVVKEIERARQIVAKVTGVPLCDLPYSASSLSRRLLDWLGLTDPFPETGRGALRGTDYHYYAVTPGRMPDAYLWDLKRCYFTLARMLPSLLPVVHPKRDRVMFRLMNSEHKARWLSIHDAICEEKNLRNVLVGTMGGGGHGVYFAGGSRKFGRSKFGPLRSAALLIARTACELDAEAAEETGYNYANTDCVISPDAKPPAAWRKYGLPVGLKASGPAEIYAIGNYRIGEWQTKLFKPAKGVKPAFSVRLQGVRYSKWLEVACA